MHCQMWPKKGEKMRNNNTEEDKKEEEEKQQNQSSKYKIILSFRRNETRYNDITN